jgi:hypothetical protein
VRSSAGRGTDAPQYVAQKTAPDQASRPSGTEPRRRAPFAVLGDRFLHAKVYWAGRIVAPLREDHCGHAGEGLLMRASGEIALREQRGWHRCQKPYPAGSASDVSRYLSI